MLLGSRRFCETTTLHGARGEFPPLYFRLADGLVQSRLIALSSISDADEQAWRELASRAIEPNPYFEPDCLLPAARYLEGGAEILLAVAESADGRFHACLPVSLASGWRSLRLPVALTRGVGRAIGLATPLVCPDHGLAAVATVLRACFGRRADQVRRACL